MVMKKGLSVIKLKTIKEMIEDKIKDIINNAKMENSLLQLTSSKGNSYFTSYSYFISFFEGFNVKKNREELLYQGANMVYGWMPTILDTQKKKGQYLNVDEVLSSIESLDDAIDQEDLKVVSYFMNNSIVGASKLLHFIYPKKYPIWDSKICGHILDLEVKNASYHVKKIENYKSYYEAIESLINKPKPPINLKKVKTILKNNEKFCEISDVRAAELILFLDAQISSELN